MSRFFPITRTLGAYDNTWFRPDLAAAVTVWAMVVPEAMAYAGIAGMPPEVGLYASIIPLLIYALMGTSRRVTVGPSAAVAALSAATVAPFAMAGTEEFLAFTSLLAIVVGVLLLLAGIAKFGIIAEFLSEPVLKGFILGVALTIALGQSGKLLKVEVEGEGFFAELFSLIGQIPETHLITAAVGLGSLAALFVLERLMPRLPAALVVVGGAIAAVSLFDLEDAGVHITGDIVAGFPSLILPDLGWSSVVALIPGAIGVAIVVYAESMALAKTFGSKHRERVDADQEMVAFGALNIGGGLFGAFTVNASNSRSAAADNAGQKSQVSSLIVVALLVLTILFLTPLFRQLPEAALGAIVIHAVWGLIRFSPVTSLRSKHRVDFWAAVATLLGVLVLDVLAGLMLGVLISLGGLMARAVRPRVAWLGRRSATGVFASRGEEGIDEVPGVSIIRFDAELFFANVAVLRDRIIEEVDATSPGTIVLDAEAITDVDTTAAEELVKLVDELESRNVRFVVARLELPVEQTLQRWGVHLDTYPLVRAAVDSGGKGPE
ncbi:MAG: sulfate permease [Actinomycetota bacterium]|nr:sulfate permease [Actinomycetota bacterium]